MKRFVGLKMLLKSYFFWIDVAFYVYPFVGFLLIAFIGSYFDLSYVMATVIWVSLFIPILFLKLYKDILKAKQKKVDFYNSKDK